MDSKDRRGRDRPAGEGHGRGGSANGGDGGLSHEVFLRFPYGILVLDAAGEVVAANAAAEELLNGALRPAAACCELLGCGRVDTPLADVCLTRLALDRDARLPETRLDVTGAGASVWVTAAPLGREASRVVVELRSADPSDRRRRTRPHWTKDAQLRIVALGRARVESQEGPIGGAWLEQRPGQVLKYLVCNRHRAVTADELARAFWPNAGQNGVRSVRHYVHELRDRLEPDRKKRSPSSFVVARQGGYALERSRVSVDLDDFEGSTAEGLAAFARGERGVARERLEAAQELYGGDLFAEDPYELWTLDERDRLLELAARGLRALIEIAEAEGDLEAAHERVSRLAALEPYDMETQRMWMSSFVRRGRRSEAARRYLALRARMLREFGEEPDFGLADL